MLATRTLTMPRVIGGIGYAFADHLRRLDHDNFGRLSAKRTTQMQRRKYSCGAAANDGYLHDIGFSR